MAASLARERLEEVLLKGLCGGAGMRHPWRVMRHAGLSVPRMVHCPVARRHLDGGSVRRIGALGVVVSLVALVSASAADRAGPGPAKDVFTAIVGSILGGPTSDVHGTDGRHHVVYELVLTNAKAVPAAIASGSSPASGSRSIKSWGGSATRETPRRHTCISTSWPAHRHWDPTACLSCSANSILSELSRRRHWTRRCPARPACPSGTRSAPPSARDSCPSIARSSTLSRPLAADATVSLGVASVTS